MKKTWAKSVAGRRPVHSIAIFLYLIANQFLHHGIAFAVDRDPYTPDPPKKISRRVKCLTTRFTSDQNNDFGDPSPPDFSEHGVVKIYTSGGQLLVWESSNSESAIERFLRGTSPKRERLKLVEENQIGELDPWDVTIEQFPEFGNKKYLYAGVMTAPKGQKTPLWPEDNWRRRVNAFAWDAEDLVWRRIANSIFKDPPDKPTWIHHSYGHQFLRDEKNKLWMFYERVTDEVGGEPYKTEIFARLVKNPVELHHREYPILKIPQRPWQSSQHGNGFLIEGARPVKINHGYLIGFSAGSFNSENYGIHFAWSKSVSEPYQPYLENGDLKNFAKELRKKLLLTWGPGRPALFRVKEEWWVLFHGILKSDYVQLKDEQRDIYLAPVEIRQNSKTPPNIHIDF